MRGSSGVADDARRERLGALGGVVFVVLDVALGAVSGEPPAGDASVGEVAAYYADHQAAVAAGLWLFGLASMALIWWFGSLWRQMVRDEGGAPRLAVVSLIGLVLAGTLSLAACAVWAATALQVATAGSSTLVFHALGSTLLAASGFGVATHVLATNAIGARARSLSSWHVVVGTVSALAFLVAAVLGPTITAVDLDVVGIVGFALWCVWILGVSHRLWSGHDVLRVQGS